MLISLQGKESFTSRVFIQATQFSKQAIERIEELGGTVAAVHHTELGMRALTRPDSFKGKLLPRFAAPVSRRERVFYSNPQTRGYLTPEVWNKCVAADAAFSLRYVHADPVAIPEEPVRFKDFLAQSPAKSA